MMKTIGEVFPPPVGEFRARNTLVQGVGRNDWSGAVKQDGMHWYVYNTWRDMLKRSYDQKFHARSPTYVGVRVCDEWLSFSAFATWLMNQRYFEDGQLDKDLLVLRNKVYCPDRCLTVPGWLNRLPNDHGAARGVVFRLPKNRGFLAACTMGAHMIGEYCRYIHDDETDAARTADDMAREFAERMIEDEEQYEGEEEE